MQVCAGYVRSGKHEEIIISGVDCPLCEAMEEITDLESKVESLAGELESAKDEAGELRGKVMDLQNEAADLEHRLDNMTESQ